MKNILRTNKVAHVAMFVSDLERSRDFYCYYFGGTAGKKYVNSFTGFQSYFIRFDFSGCQLELMQKTGIILQKPNEFLGLAHVAISVGSREKVQKITAVLEFDGYQIASAPRITGDGYFESVVVDPDGILVEITV